MPSLAAAQIEAHPRRLAGSIEAHLRAAAAAAGAGAALVVFPELSLTSYDTSLRRNDALAPDDPALAPLRSLARERRIVIVAGAPLASGNGLLIGSLIFGNDGSVETYTKCYLHHSETPTFAPGSGGPLLSVAGTTIGLAICAEVNHPAHIVDTVASGARVYASSCFLSPGGYDRDFHRLQSCAAVHGVVALMANFADSPALPAAGKSAAWDAGGHLLAAAPADGEWLVIAEPDGDRWTGRTLAVDSRVPSGYR